MAPRFEDEYLSVTSAQVFAMARVLSKSLPEGQSEQHAYLDALVKMAVEITGYTEEICLREILG